MLAQVCVAASAAEIQSLDVTHADGRYIVSLRVLLDASAPRAYAAFAKAENLPLINPAVEQVRWIDAGSTLFTQVHVCAALFCKTLHQVQQMHFSARADGGDIDANVIPGQSDFRYGSAQWRFREADGRTRLMFDAQIEPAFWIPPLLGPWLVENSLREEAQRTSAGIERLAREAP